MKLSVLMSVYCKEQPMSFDRAMQSIWDDQTVKPNEVILVQDGKLTNELYEVIEEWQGKFGQILKIIILKKNVGLGDALNAGLAECSYEIVARMDTDDIALPQRFEKQLKIFEENNVDVCSSWVGEFDKNEKEIVGYRDIPESHQDIVVFAKKRNPINHPAVMYRKSAVEGAGGYKRMMWFEDYYLWVRMIINGANFYNIQYSLVSMRTGCGQLERRSGLKYAISEFVLQKKFLDLGFINYYEFIRNIFVRFIARIIPKYFIKFIYKKTRCKF